MTNAPFPARAFRAALFGAALVASLGASTRGSAQGSCFVNNQNTCTIGPSATYSFTITIPSTVRLTLPSVLLGLGTATSADFAAGFGSAASIPITVRANVPWTIAIRSTATLWTGTPGTARQDKPGGDLQWGLAAGGPFTDLTTTAVSLSTGTATSLTTVPLHLRARLDWTLDVPGAYSLPLQVTLTSP